MVGSAAVPLALFNPAPPPRPAPRLDAEFRARRTALCVPDSPQDGAGGGGLGGEWTPRRPCGGVRTFCRGLGSAGSGEGEVVASTRWLVFGHGGFTSGKAWG